MAQMLSGSPQISFVSGSPYLAPSPVPQFNAIHFREKLVVNSTGWPEIQQMLPVANDFSAIYSLDNTLMCEPCLFQPTWQTDSQIIPAVVVQESIPSVADTTWIQNRFPNPGRSSSPSLSKYASPQLKTLNRRNSNEATALRIQRSENQDTEHLRPSISTDNTHTLQREIELAAARTRIAMLEKVFFPESFAYLKKREENAAQERKECTKERSEKIEDEFQKEEGIQCRLSFEEAVSSPKDKLSVKQSDRSDLQLSPRLPVYPKQPPDGSANSRSRSDPAGRDLGAAAGALPEQLSPSGNKPSIKVVEMVRTVAPGRDPGQGAGVGMIFQQTKLTGKMIVSGLAPGGPAALSGRVSLGDVIHAIDGVPVAGRSISEVVAMIKGPEGSRVAIALQDYESNVRRVVLRREPAAGREAAPGEAVGVGVAIQASRSTGAIVVVGVAPGGSAARSGAVAPGDIVHAIDGAAVQGLPIPEVVARIKGPAATEIVMHLESTGADPGTAPSSPRRASQQQPAPPASPPAGGSDAQTPAAAPQPADWTEVGPGRSPRPALASPDGGAAMAAGAGAADPATPAGRLPGGTKRVGLRRRAFAPMAAAARGGGIVLGGIGMSFVVSEGRHIVSQLAPNGSAQASGRVEVGDIILSVNDVPAHGKSVKELISEIVGPENTEVVVVLQSGSVQL